MLKVNFFFSYSISCSIFVTEKSDGIRTDGQKMDKKWTEERQRLDKKCSESCLIFVHFREIMHPLCFFNIKSFLLCIILSIFAIAYIMRNSLCFDPIAC